MRVGSPPTGGKRTGDAPARSPSTPAAPGGSAPSAPVSSGVVTDESQIEFDPIDGHDHDGVNSHTVDHANLANVTANQHHAQLHQAAHQSGGGDALTGLLDATARVSVRKNNTGAAVGARRQIDFIEGANITLTIADDGAGEEVDITIAAAASGNHFLWTPLAPPSGGSQWAAMPLAVTELYGQTAHRAAFDLTNFTQIRFFANVVGAGSTNSKLRVQYSTDSGATWNAIGSISDVEVQINSTGLRTVAFLNLIAGAKADVWLRIAGVGGDGVASPTLGTIGVEFK